jgi:hypothetical protein
MNQHQIGNPDIVAGEMSRNGAEAQVGHLYYPMEVIGCIGHGEEQDLHYNILHNLSDKVPVPVMGNTILSLRSDKVTEATVKMPRRAGVTIAEKAGRYPGYQPQGYQP